MYEQHKNHIVWRMCMSVRMQMKQNNPYPDAPSWNNRACSSRLPSSIDHQPNNLLLWIVRLGRRDNMHMVLQQEHNYPLIKTFTVMEIGFTIFSSNCTVVIHYLEPWCMNPKQSWALEENLKYLPPPAPLRSRSISFSTNLDAANSTPAPCSRKRGEKRIGSGIFLAPEGVPWNSEQPKALNVISQWHHNNTIS